MFEASGRRWWHTTASILTVAILLLWPAWLNRQPILFPDSIGYERAGVVALHVAGFDTDFGHPLAAEQAGTIAGVKHGMNGVSTVRSPFYGIPVAVLLAIGGTWGAAAGQALIVAAALVLAGRRGGVGARVAVPAVAALIAVTGIAVFSATLMPDIFLALMILGFALILALPDIPRAETGFWLAAILAATLFHKAFLAVAVGMTLVALVVDRRIALRKGVLLLLAVTCTLGAAGHFVVEYAVKRYTGRASVGVPFLLARYAASPVLIDYLDDHCAEPQFAMCIYRSRLPLAPDAFLWGPRNVYVSLSELDRRALADEAGDLLARAFTARPLAAAAEAIRGSVASFITVGMDDYAIGISPLIQTDRLLASTMQAYPATRVARRVFPFAAFDLAASLAYGAGFGALGYALWRLRRRLGTTPPPAVVFTVAIVTGAVLNAVVSGTLSGVFERYQGRIAWLIPFAAVLLLAGRAFRPGADDQPRRMLRPA